jgi:protein-tyrosine phosphatase
MQHVFWLIPGKLAGRPGPNQEPWNVEELQRGGIGAVLSVNAGILVNPEDFLSRGMRYARIPFSDKAPPMPGDLEICLTALPRAYDFVSAEIQAGKAALVHCRSGKDRTGLLMAYYLMRTTGVSVDDAIRQVRLVRPIALSAEGWDEFAREILRRA